VRPYFLPLAYLLPSLYGFVRFSGAASPGERIGGQAPLTAVTNGKSPGAGTARALPRGAAGDR
jgi:hypothetical protein